MGYSKLLSGQIAAGQRRSCTLTSWLAVNMSFTSPHPVVLSSANLHLHLGKCRDCMEVQQENIEAETCQRSMTTNFPVNGPSLKEYSVFVSQ